MRSRICSCVIRFSYKPVPSGKKGIPPEVFEIFINRGSSSFKSRVSSGLEKSSLFLLTLLGSDIVVPNMLRFTFPMTRRASIVIVAFPFGRSASF